MRLFGKNKIKNATTADLNTLHELFGIDLHSDDISADKLYSATYYACMDIRCKALAKLPLKIYQDTSEGTKKVTDFYLYDLLKLRPNPYMTIHDFLYAIEFQKLEHGNAYIAMKTTKKGEIVALYPLDSTKMTIWIDDLGVLSATKNAIWYEYQDTTGSLKFRSDEIIHLKNFTKDGIVGEPVKKYLLDTIENEQYGTKFLNNHYRNGLSGKAVLNYVSSLKDESVDSLRQRFEKMTSGIKNAGRIIPVPMGFELKPFEVNLVDADFFKLQGLTIKHIANAFGVKMFQLNDMERSTYSNIETQNIAFYSDTLQNVLTETEQELAYKLLTKYQRLQGYFFKFNVDSILRSDFKTRMEGYAIAVQNAIYTSAECREIEDKMFIEGSDKLICNGNMIPLEKAGKQYEKGGD